MLIEQTEGIEMRITLTDRDQPGFWTTHKMAERAVLAAVGLNRLQDAEDDKIAKAVTDAAEALCKAMLLHDAR
jgi:hypothetical protein